ncbi:NADH-quinone oxidoreductase subunit M [Xanthocytophaga agilis]|uniref:NADH-quinone oxidoreductase subunit M n=1 Tax=Xanthocytophaga agilis TaxID=3048010 RepID=A0AAE3RBC2_9BACT|nr:NADH-quinone oxidoreductase subunit M [Xanthocytophaga agilis]MDJ1505062.1 NADH-quinone oxidoreductase subunit M [Xanthocytophaga agilis]
MLTLSLILIPAIASLLLPFIKGEITKTIAFVVALAELAVALFAITQFSPDTVTPQFAYDYPWIASLGVHFSGGMDGISMLLVLLTTILTPLIVLSTFGYSYNHSSAFYALILLMEAALVGVFTSQDAFVFYLFWEAALIPVYFLAAIWGGEKRIAITFKFFIYTIFGSLFMLVALVYLYMQTPGNHSSAIADIYKVALDSHTQSWVFWALFIAFAIKMPIFPFHTWQPDTYTESPTPATMLLSGIMLKMGIYGVIRWLLPIVPAGVAQWSTTVIILSIIGIIYGSIIAIQQKDLKKLLAYSSFAHVGLMAAGVFSLTLKGMQGAVIQMLAHGINVVGLFFVAEIIQRRLRTRDIDRMGGITQNTPVLTVFFMILMLGSVALPLTNGFVGEFLLLSGVYEFNHWYGAIAGLTIIFGAVYMLKMFQGVMFGEQNHWTEKVTDITLTESAVLFPLVVLVFWMGIAPGSFLKLTEPAVIQILQLATGK